MTKLSLLLVAFATVMRSAGEDRLPSAPGHHTIQFAKSAVQSGADEVQWRLHSVEKPGALNITKERLHYTSRIEGDTFVDSAAFDFAHRF